MPTIQNPPRDRFSVEPYLPAWPQPLRHACGVLADRALGFRGLTQRYHRIPDAASPREFAGLALSELGVVPIIEEDDLAHVPATGGCLLVANHPHGGLDGLVLMEILLRRRPDVRFMANHFLTKFAEL